MILNPTLMITYRERSRTGIATNALATVSFTAEYAMDTDNFWNTIRGLFIAAMVIFAVIVVVHICIWSWGPTLEDDASAKCKYAIVKFGIIAIDVFSNLFFWFIVLVTGYWFIFFKLQERVYVLLP